MLCDEFFDALNILVANHDETPTSGRFVLSHVTKFDVGVQELTDLLEELCVIGSMHSFWSDGQPANDAERGLWKHFRWAA